MMQKNIYLKILLGTILILLIPLLLMNLQIPLDGPGSGYSTFNWGLADFIIMGLLIFGTASLFVAATKKFKSKISRIAFALLLFLGFLWLWAELAVGIFTNWGN